MDDETTRRQGALCMDVDPGASNYRFSSAFAVPIAQKATFGHKAPEGPKVESLLPLTLIFEAITRRRYARNAIESSGVSPGDSKT